MLGLNSFFCWISIQPTLQPNKVGRNSLRQMEHGFKL